MRKQKLLILLHYIFSSWMTRKEKNYFIIKRGKKKLRLKYFRRTWCSKRKIIAAIRLRLFLLFWEKKNWNEKKRRKKRTYFSRVRISYFYAFTNRFSIVLWQHKRARRRRTSIYARNGWWYHIVQYYLHKIGSGYTMRCVRRRFECIT